jgi:hypothetical protein
VPAKLANKPTIAIDLPTVNSTDGSVHLLIKNLESSLAVEDKGETTMFSIGSELREALNKALPSPATVSPKFTLGLPQCISMNNVRFEAAPVRRVQQHKDRLCIARKRSRTRHLHRQFREDKNNGDDGRN